MEHDEIKQNVCNKAQWCRLLYMLLFGVVLYLVLCLLGVVVVVQLVFALFTGSPHDGLTQFGSDLSRYIHRITEFLTYNEDRRPYPFNPWDEKTDDVDNDMEDFDDEEDYYAVDDSDDSLDRELGDDDKPSR